jgi:hypothetical protein
MAGGCGVRDCKLPSAQFGYCYRHWEIERDKRKATRESFDNRPRVDLGQIKLGKFEEEELAVVRAPIKRVKPCVECKGPLPDERGMYCLKCRPTLPSDPWA